MLSVCFQDSELLELRKTIEALQQQSAEAGLTKAALQSMQAVQRSKTFSCPNKGQNNGDNASKSLPQLTPGSPGQDGRVVDASGEDSSSLILGTRDSTQLQQGQHSKDKRGVVIRRHTFNNSTTATTTTKNNNNNNINNNNNNAKENNTGAGGGVLNGENECENEHESEKKRKKWERERFNSVNVPRDIHVEAYALQCASWMEYVLLIYGLKSFDFNSQLDRVFSDSF